ncbi:exosortase Y-associated Wzy-like protein [Salinibacter ruber]|uniref:exosortase Y-associated Wzy-like protein n=1 Tax=Salinibacter ruber TaxID=146919 RepID=UPI000E592C98|nr:hypothetical protein [Salinibacter ruber]
MNTVTHQVPSVLRREERTGLAYLLLYSPAALAWIFVSSPLLSFGIAWAGSLVIFWASTTGKIRSLPSDRPWSRQLFRPIFLLQLMFMAYFFSGSIFHVWNVLSSPSIYGPAEELARTAAAQRYYVLGHGAFAHGLLWTMDYRRSGEWELQYDMNSSSLLLGAAIALGSALFISQIPGMGQFVGKLEKIAAVALIIGLADAIRKGNRSLLLLGAGIYSYLLLQTFLSGWKHLTIFVTGLLLVALYPYYKRTVVVTGLALGLLFVTVLPAYNSAFRNLNWRGEVSAQEAAQTAIKRVQEGEIDVGEVSWRFLTNRLTTVNLFANYIEHVPRDRPYYGFEIVEQGIYAIVPGVLWPNKPNSEELAMQRAYESDAVQPYSGVSAKPKFIVDAYLSGGALGILFGFWVIGWAAGMTSSYVERWLGGYEIGGRVFYTALFTGAWLTPSFEFLFNTIFWSGVLAVMITVGLYLSGVLHRRSRQAQRA